MSDLARYKDESGWAEFAPGVEQLPPEAVPVPVPVPVLVPTSKPELVTGLPAPTSPKEPEFQVAEASPPDKFKFVPKEKRSKSSSEEPSKEEPKVTEPEPPATFRFVPPEQRAPKKEAPPPSYGTAANVAAGAVEGTVPGVAHAAASPLDIPVNVARAGVHSLMGIYSGGKAVAKDIGGLFGWATPETGEEFLQREKQLAEDVPIPASPGGNYLTRKAGEIGLPTPQTPFPWITPTNEAERIGRRAGQVGGQIAATTIGSRAYSPLRPYVAPGADLTGTPRGLVAGMFEGPRVMGSIPAGQAGAVAGGASAAGQYAAERAKESGASPEAVNLIEKGTNIAATVPLAAGGAVASAAGRVAGVPRLTTIPGQELASSGIFGPFAAKRAQDQLNARLMNRSPVKALTNEGDWERSSADVRQTLDEQLKLEQARSDATRNAEQAAADAAVGSIGGTDGNLLSRINKQETEIGSEISTMKADIPSIGNQIRTGINRLVRRDGVFGKVKAEDPKNKGKPLVPDSKVPELVFNSKVTYEDLAAMFNKASRGFREAYQAIGLDDFIRKTEKLGPDGKPNGQIDLTKAADYLEKNKALLDNVETQMEKQWGPKALEDHGIRSRIGQSIERQKGIDALNSQRDELLKGVLRTGGRDATSAKALWGPGAEGARGVNEYLRIMGKDPDAVHNIVEIAAADLRNFARKVGTTELDDSLANRWLKSHQDALNALPADARNKFRDAASAQETVQMHAAARAKAIEAFKTGAAKEMLEGTTAKEALKNIFNDTTKAPDIAIKEISDKLRSNLAAHDALKRDFMEVGVERAQAETRAELRARPETFIEGLYAKIRRPGDPAAHDNSVTFMKNFNKFLSENEASAKELFGESAVDSMNKIMKDHPSPGYKKPGPIGAVFVSALAAGEAGGWYAIQHLINNHHVSTAIAAAGLIGIAGFRKLKGMGITNVNDLIPKIMSDPELARAMTRPATDQAAWAQVMKRLAIIGGDEEAGKYGIGQPATPSTR